MRSILKLMESYGLKMIWKRYLNWLKHKLHLRNDIFGLRFTITWKCDSRCITCAIWKDKTAGRNDLSVEEIDKFSKSRHFRKVEYITISGGEPTLRSDLVDIISILHRNVPTARFAQKTIGLLENSSLRQQVVKNALKVINERYTWERVIPELDRDFRETILEGTRAETQ